MATYVIIGGVAGGASCAARLRRLDEKVKILMVERGPYVSYANCGLPYFVSRDIERRSKLLLQTPEGFESRYGVKVLVEVGLKGFNVDPAQGTHFFQNVTSLNIGCLSVPYGSEAFIRWDQLREVDTPLETPFLRLLRWENPLEVSVDGLRGEAVIVLPAN